MLVSRSSDHLAGVHKLYGEIWASTDPEFEVAIAAPGAPRGPELLFDYATALGLAADARVLDIGARDAIHAIELARRYGCRVIAADPVPIHHDLARQRLAEADPEIRERVELSDAAIEHLPFADDSFDLVWARDMLNHVALRRGLVEAFRVLKPGGRFCCLEFSHPVTEGFQAVYDAYSFRVIPWLGEKIAGDRDSYQYLVESIRRFPAQKAFSARISAAGFSRVSHENLSGGIAALHTGWKTGY